MKSPMPLVALTIVWGLLSSVTASPIQAQDVAGPPKQPQNSPLQPPALPGTPTADTDKEDEEDDKTTFSFETDFTSRYVYRGLALSEGPVVQSGIYVSRRGYTLGLWGNLNASHRGGLAAMPRKLDEVDVTLTKSIERGKTTFEPSVLLYLYPTDASPTTGELTLRLSHSFKKFSVFTSHTVDFLEYKGAYFGEVGLEKEREFSSRLSGAAKISLGVGNGTFNETNIGIRKRALNVAALDLSLTYALTPRLYLRPHWSLTHILDTELRGALIEPRLFNIGIVIGGEF